MNSIIDFEQKNTPNFGQDVFQTSSDLLKNNFYSFVIEPLRRLRYVYESMNILTGQEAVESHQNWIKWIQSVEKMVQNTQSSDAFQQLRKSYEAGDIKYEQLLNTASYQLYLDNADYALYRAKAASLHGIDTENTEESESKSEQSD